jgi:CPA2 family monovalent cation:H+ antiporter-2
VGLAVTVVILGRWLIPWALERIEQTRSRELFTLAVLVLAVGIAVGSARIFGVSMALGAFLAGLAVGRSEFAARAAGDAVPMRDAFAVLFFFSRRHAVRSAKPVQVLLLIATVLAVVVGKPLAALLTVRALASRWPRPTVGAVLPGRRVQLHPGTVMAARLADDGWNALVAASILSIALNPGIYRWPAGASSAPAITPFTDGCRPAIDPGRRSLVGYGPVGRIVHRLPATGSAVTD